MTTRTLEASNFMMLMADESGAITIALSSFVWLSFSL
jgi:hypothetical protein